MRLNSRIDNFFQLNDSHSAICVNEIYDLKNTFDFVSIKEIIAQHKFM